MHLPFFNKEAKQKEPDPQILSLNQRVSQLTFLENTLRSKIIQSNLALSAVSEGIILLNQKLEIILVNRAAFSILDCSEGDLIGKGLDSVIEIFDKDTKLSSTHLFPVQKDKAEAEIFSKKNLKISCKREGIVNLRTWQFNQGGIFYFCLQFEDAKRQSELENMKLDFVSMAAHELRTPVTSIGGYMSVFLNENKDKLTVDQKKLLDAVVNSTSQLRVLVEDLLNISRIEKGIMNVNLETVDYLFIIADTLKFFRERAVEKNIQFEFEKKEETIPTIRMDKVRINEVLSNLLSNAVKYTDSGGKITVWLETSGNELITHVSDTGKGIDPNILPNLFNKFYRAVTPLDQSIKGTGLGLYIAKSIVEMHHGKIWAQSLGLGKGATFSFSLPI